MTSSLIQRSTRLSPPPPLSPLFYPREAELCTQHRRTAHRTTSSTPSQPVRRHSVSRILVRLSSVVTTKQSVLRLRLLRLCSRSLDLLWAPLYNITCRSISSRRHYTTLSRQLFAYCNSSILAGLCRNSLDRKSSRFRVAYDFNIIEPYSTHRCDWSNPSTAIPHELSRPGNATPARPGAAESLECSIVEPRGGFLEDNTSSVRFALLSRLRCFLACPCTFHAHSQHVEQLAFTPS